MGKKIKLKTIGSELFKLKNQVHISLPMRAKLQRIKLKFGKVTLDVYMRKGVQNDTMPTYSQLIKEGLANKLKKYKTIQ